MQSGYYNTTGGIVTQFNRLNVISNNLANLNTSGYKRDDVVIGDFQRVYQEERDKLPLHNNTKEASKFLNRSLDRVPQVVEEYTDRTIGSFRQTGNTLDFALQRDDVFFAIDTPQGVRYTRDGSFTTDNEGRLVTKEGYTVLPSNGTDGSGSIEIPSDLRVTTDANGVMYADDQPFAQIGVVQFDNAKYLTKEGGNLYRNADENPMSVVEESGAVVSEFVETSNVNAITEMTSLIETNRLVEMYQKVMRTHMDDLNSDAINKLAAVDA